jgi:hypothetical protein
MLYNLAPQERGVGGHSERRRAVTVGRCEGFRQGGCAWGGTKRLARRNDADHPLGAGKGIDARHNTDYLERNLKSGTQGIRSGTVHYRAIHHRPQSSAVKDRTKSGHDLMGSSGRGRWASGARRPTSGTDGSFHRNRGVSSALNRGDTKNRSRCANRRATYDCQSVDRQAQKHANLGLCHRAPSLLPRTIYRRTT